MPGGKVEISPETDGPVPAWRPGGDQRLSGRLPAAGRVHRKDPQTGVWIEDEPAPLADVDDLESQEEVSAVRRDARAVIAKGERDLRRLAVPAMTDEKVRQECVDIQSRLRAAHDVIELDSLAREETARCDAEAAEAEERQRREAHLALAAKLEQKRTAAAEKIDKGAQMFAAAIAEYNSLIGPLEQELRAGGHPDPMSVRPAPWSYMAALKAAGVGREFDFPPQTPAAPFAGK